MQSILCNARYRDLDADGQFWIPSGRAFFSPDTDDPAEQELEYARAHFYLPHRFRDSFGNTTIIAYDEKYNLSLVYTRDAAGNEAASEPDYRVLQPRKVTDPNGNRAQARFDALGMLAGTALLGKEIGPVEGDSFHEFVTDLTPSQNQAFFDADDPCALASEHLGTATTRILYDLTRVPMCAASIARETHVSDLAHGERSRVQLHFVYTDGFGREAQSKIQAEPGPLNPDDPASRAVNPRWVGSGEKIYNNKGKPVREYEPFFSATPRFGIEKWGVSNTLFYDPVLRVVATLHPNNTYEKVVFNPWKQITFDVNDTVTFDPRTDEDVGEYFSRLPDSDYLPTWFRQRVDGAGGPDERAAAIKASRDADTPTVAHFDSLGRTVLSVVDNGDGEYFSTRSVLDIEGNQRAVIDALDRVVIRYDYDMLGTRIRQASMEAGERWMLNDVSGKPVRAWNSRGFSFRTEYDELRRPVESFVAGETLPCEIVSERTVYGDSHETGLSEAQGKQANLRGKPFRHFDGAGVIVTDLNDFKGNPLRTKRQFAREYKRAVDWSHAQPLESRTFSSATKYDALNRAIAVTAPDKSVYRPRFNDANLLEAVDVNLRGAEQNGRPVWTPFVTYINYDAKGQRTTCRYGNNLETTYRYDEKTFRLVYLKTTRKAVESGRSAKIFRHPSTVQDLHYTYDPVGNITRIEDRALNTVFHANQRVDPVCEYTYDSLYRLVEATGREHIGQSAFNFVPAQGDNRDYPFEGAAQLADLQALERYTECYAYDPVGNFMSMVHRASHRNWTRTYRYCEASLLEPLEESNRLSETSLETHAGAPVERYDYDVHGNMTRMPHLPSMRWNYKDQLSATSRQVVNSGEPETTYYVYDASGRRARKVTESGCGKRSSERFYVGRFEVFQEYSDHEVLMERETLHVMDDKQRIALVETKTIEDGDAIQMPRTEQRYQLANHLGSACVEVDEAGGLISYEEYSPYGESTFQAGIGGAEVRRKRYRYTSKERDEENGFTYHGARYHAPWLGRWTACDPKGVASGVNLYEYCQSDPIGRLDLNGADGESWFEKTRGYARDTALGQGILGAIEGTVQALTPYGGFAPPQPGVRQAFEVGKGVAQLVVGVVEEYGGSGLIAGGAGLAGAGGAGELVTAGVATPIAVPAIAAGAGVVTTGIVLAAHGGKNFVAGAKTLQNAMHNSEGLAAESSPSTQTPSETPSEKLATTNEPPASNEVAENANSAVPTGQSAAAPAVTNTPPPAGASVKDPHGNALTSTKTQHLYTIHDAQTPGIPYKTGVSGQPLLKNGASTRANRQISKLNRDNPVPAGQDPRFSATVDITGLPNRAAALNMEQHLVNSQKYTHGKPGLGNTLPKPNLNLGPLAR